MGLEDQVSITRIEQLHPFPHSRIRDELNRYPEGVQVFCVLIKNILCSTLCLQNYTNKFQCSMLKRQLIDIIK